MAKPIIFAIDDEIQVVNAIERDLHSHYGKDYRIMKATSGEKALEIFEKLKQRNDPLALIVTDQRMPGMEGTEFLARAMDLFPETKKVLLTAYADTEVAIAAINEIGLDHYLMKPWSPPEENLYPVLDDLLGDWLENSVIPYDGIRVAGTLWSPYSHTVKDFLARSQIPYQWLDIENDGDARAMVESVDRELKKLPVIFFPDGTVMVAPEIKAIAEKAGLRTKATQPFYDLIIIGAGPAGLAGAVYGASEGLRTLLIEKETTGGQAGTSSRIENYLGFPKGLSGGDLTRRATAQAIRLGAEILTAQEVKEVKVKGSYRCVRLSDGTWLNCHALMIATGASWRTLDVPGIEALTGAGVYYGAALTEAANYKGKDVFVVGGANSAGQGAVFLSGFANKVTMIVRGSDLRHSMSQYLVNQISENEKIEVLTNTTVKEVAGNDRLTTIVVENSETGKTNALPAAALFIFIGARPHSELVADIVERNPKGFILTGQDLVRNGKRPRNWKLKRDPFLVETSVPGIFAVGDVREGSIKRVAAAVGQGSAGVSFVHQYLKTV